MSDHRKLLSDARRRQGEIFDPRPIRWEPVVRDTEVFEKHLPRFRDRLAYLRDPLVFLEMVDPLALIEALCLIDAVNATGAVLKSESRRDELAGRMFELATAYVVFCVRSQGIEKLAGEAQAKNEQLQDDRAPKRFGDLSKEWRRAEAMFPGHRQQTKRIEKTAELANCSMSTVKRWLKGRC